MIMVVRVISKVLFPLALFAKFFGGQFASAQTAPPQSGTVTLETLQQQIQSLLGVIQGLQSKVNALESQSSASSLRAAPPVQPQSSPPVLSEDVIQSEMGPPVAPPIITRPLSRGARGDDVRALQEFLARDPGIYPERLTTGYFGPSTQSAVSRWQKKYGIESAGVVGPLTIAKFRDLGQMQTGTEQPSEPFITDTRVPPPVPPTIPTPRDSSLVGQLCPAVPTVDSCPAGQERTVSYQSAQCGLYYSCVPSGSHTATPFPYTFTNGKTVNSWADASSYCWANGPGSGQGVAAECEAKFGVIYPNATLTTPITGPVPFGQKNQAWNALGLQSWIRTDADVSRIATLKQACQSTPFGSNVWMTSAGNPASTDFGMPSLDKCRLAASCTTGQYFDGARCVASGTGSWGSGGSGSNWVWHTWNFRDGSTTQSNILNRTDKEYLDFIASVDTQCRTLVTQSQFSWKTGAGNDAASNWQNFGIPNCSGTATINSSSTTTTPSSGQKEQVWNSQGLRSWIRSDADPVRIAQAQQACTAVPQGANVWTAGAGTYTSADFGMPDPDKCHRAAACTANQYFDGTACSSGSTTTGTGGCSALGYGWTMYGSYCLDGSRHQYVPLTSLTLSSVQSCVGNDSPVVGCTPLGSSSSCPSGYYWYTPPGSSNGACIPNGSGSTSCPSGQYWYTPPSSGS